VCSDLSVGQAVSHMGQRVAFALGQFHPWYRNG
jgi:hypothetical protein